MDFKANPLLIDTLGLYAYVIQAEFNESEYFLRILKPLEKLREAGTLQACGQTEVGQIHLF